LHLVDPTMGPEAALEAYKTVRSELAAYGGGLDEKPEILALSKCDAVSEDELEACRVALAGHAKGNIRSLSAVAQNNVVETVRALRLVINAAREEESEDFDPFYRDDDEDDDEARESVS
jgi:GTP-binding protein